MHAYDDTPLLHTVVFEPINPERPVSEGDNLILAIKSLAKIRGVDVRAAERSISTPAILEEATLNGNRVLQELRNHPVHDELLDIAKAHTNWKVVDRPLPQGYEEEPDFIKQSRQQGNTPLAKNLILTFHDDVSQPEVDTLLEQASNSFGNAEHELVSPAEVSLSLDSRKGRIAIFRSNWHSEDALKRYLLSKDSQRITSDLSDTSSQIDVTYRL